MVALGKFYAQGRGGLPRSPDRARKWFQRAVKEGSEEAQACLEALEKSEPKRAKSSASTAQPAQPKAGPTKAEKRKTSLFRRLFGGGR